MSSYRPPSPPTHPKNAAAWQLRPKQRPLVLSGAPYTPPPPGHLVIRTGTLAINPIDWKLQTNDLFHLPYPFIFGSDVAGTVYEIGDGVDQGFVPGQRVIAIASGMTSRLASRGGFQRFVVVAQEAVCAVPAAMGLEEAVVLPLAICTAAAGLYQRDYLGFKFPSSDAAFVREHQDEERVVLVWGGASSVGSATVQLAHASGVTVFTTASKENFAFCEGLGASRCFSYRDFDVEDQIVRAMKGKTCVGAYDAVGAAGACARVVDRCQGKAIVVTTAGVSESDHEVPKSVRIKMSKCTITLTLPVTHTNHPHPSQSDRAPFSPTTWVSTSGESFSQKRWNLVSSSQRPHRSRSKTVNPMG